MSDGIKYAHEQAQEYAHKQQAKRNVELLKIVLHQFDEPTSSPYLCDIIHDAAHLMGGEYIHQRGTMTYLHDWIQYHIGHNFGVYEWLREKGYAAGYSNYDTELKEYRRLWLRDMIAYWENEAK